MRIIEKIKILDRSTIVMRVILLVMAFYLVVFPYFPKLEYAVSYFNEDVDPKNNLPIEVLSALNRGENLLYISKSQVNRAIIETDNIKNIHEDVWIWPDSKKPNEGGNTVLLAHRYASIGGNRASTFYNLPEMATGDKSYVVWSGKIYEYEVFETFTVDPSHIEILQNTDENILTMFTCTPLWTSKERFVVRSKLVNVWE